MWNFNWIIYAAFLLLFGGQTWRLHELKDDYESAEKVIFECVKELQYDWPIENHIEV